MDIKELWQYDGLMHRGVNAKITLNKKLFLVKDISDIRRIYNLEQSSMRQDYRLNMDKWFNEDKQDLINKQLDWLIEDILPKKLKEVARVIEEISQLKELKER